MIDKRKSAVSRGGILVLRQTDNMREATGLLLIPLPISRFTSRLASLVSRLVSSRLVSSHTDYVYRTVPNRHQSSLLPFYSVTRVQFFSLMAGFVYRCYIYIHTLLVGETGSILSNASESRGGKSTSEMNSWLCGVYFIRSIMRDGEVCASCCVIKSSLYFSKK